MSTINLDPLEREIPDPEVDPQRGDADGSNGTMPEPEPQPSESVLDRLAKVRFDVDRPPPDDPVVFSVGGVEVCHPGNITVVEAHEKSGKSAFVSAGVASTFAAEAADCLGWTSDGNSRGLAVLHFDCEQSRGDHHRLLVRAIARAGTNAPPWLLSYCVTGWNSNDMRAAILTAVAEATRTFGGIHSLWLDGVADPVNSPNDETECFAFVCWLQMLVVQHACPIIGILHLNPGDSGKSRGHLGSELNRKAETVLRVTKDEDGVSTVASQWTRGAPIPRGAAPCFVWSNEDGRHVTVAGNAGTRRDAKREELHSLAKEVFRDVPAACSMTWTAVHERIEELNGIKCEGARRWFKKLTDAGLLHESTTGWRLAKW